MRAIRYCIVILTTLLLAWILPGFYHLMIDKSSNNVFTYYSSVEKAFCTMDYVGDNEGPIRKNIKTGETYNESEFDSILPMFYLRQLVTDRRFPDSIYGRPVDATELKNKMFYFRYNSKNKRTPFIPLYILFESKSGRVNLDMPGDMFRLKHNIEFVDLVSNKVNREKSDLFMNAFEKSDFVFPAKRVFGNASPRKAYDEGYFVIDNIGQVFHLKMEEGKPFLRNTHFPKDIKPEYIRTLEPSDRSFYGFVFDDESNVYVMTTEGYKCHQIQTPTFDSDRDKMIIMGNPFYWNVCVTSSKGKEVYALNAENKAFVDSVSFIDDTPKDIVLSYVFPFKIKLVSASTNFVEPILSIASLGALLFNFILMLLYCSIAYIRHRKVFLSYSIWIAITGIFGFIPCLLLRK